MKPQSQNLRRCALIASLAALQGCSIFLPAHTHSNFREDEKVAITLFKTCEELNASLGRLNAKPDVYDTVFGAACKLPTPEQPLRSNARPEMAPLAAAAVGIAIDVIREQLTKEAELYESQWEHQVSRDDFWEKVRTEDSTHLRQRYVGFEVCRKVGEVGTSGCATSIVFGMKSSADSEMFLIAPLAFRMQYAKAKVLSDEWITFIPPWIVATAPGKFARVAGHTLDTKVSIEMDSFWKKEGELAMSKVAALSFSVNGYSLNAPAKTLTPWDGLPAQPVGWLLGVPVTDQNVKKNGTRAEDVAGNFTLRVLVTEKDTSNAKHYLEEAAKQLENKKPMIQNLITQKLSGSNTPDKEAGN